MNFARLVALGVSLAAIFLTGTPGAFAEDNEMLLFKIVFPKGDVIIGLTEGQLTAAGGLNAETVRKMLVATGELSAWQYMALRGATGQLVQAPINWISIVANDTLRIEPYTADWPVIPPTAE